MGVAHHSAYVPWLENGRVELLRTCGVAYRELEEAGLLLVVARLELSFKAPARNDDQLLLITRVTGGGRARIDHGYELWRDDSPAAADGGFNRTTLLLTASSTIASVDRGGRVRPLPDWLAEGGRPRAR
ncbi:MAG: acyl-CoA thioesterase [Phycisphaerales bacterium]|nr:acyl-CoA thioesterase [Phycisphaerales bacterium]